jgi:hypothetical protein
MIHEGTSRNRTDAKRDGHPEAEDWLCRLRQLLSRSSTFLPPALGGGLDCPPLCTSSEVTDDPSKLARALFRDGG